MKLMKNYCIFFVIFAASIVFSQARFYSSRSCDRPRKPRNGKVECNPSSKNESECTFSCNPTYTLIGSHHTRCYYGYSFGEGRYTRYFWSDRSPFCHSTSCPEQFGINNADFHCTGHKPGDYCTYSCFHQFQLFPSDKEYQDCLTEGNWTSSPCCAEEAHCSGEKKADIVIALDSSTKFGKKRWRTMKKFIRRFIDLFSVEENVTRFSIFRYDARVDEDSKILLNEFIDDRIGLLETYDEMPDNLNQGNFVNQALQYIAGTVLTTENGDRPNVQDVILLVSSITPDDAGRLHLPGFHESYQPKIFIVTLDALDNIMPQEIKNIRNNWKDVTPDEDAVYFAESSALQGLELALQRDMKSFVCQIEACSSEQE